MPDFKKVKNFFSAVQNKKIKVLGKLRLTSKDEKAFSERTREDDIREYRASVGLSKELKCIQSFSEFLGARISNIDAVARLKKREGEENVTAVIAGQGASLQECLNDAEGAPHIRALSNAFTPLMRDEVDADGNPVNDDAGNPIRTDRLQEAGNNYERRLQKLNEISRRSPPQFNLSAMAGYIKAEQKKMEDLIKEQQAAEIERLTTALKAPPDGELNDDLIRALRLENDDPIVQTSNIQQFNARLLAAVKKAHEEQLSNFEKNIVEDVKNLHEFAAIERRRINVLSQLEKRSKQMTKAIDDLQPNEPENEDGNVEIIMERDNNARYKGIKVTDVPYLETVLGRPIQYDKTTDSFSMKLPWLNPFYYRRSGRLQSDLDSIAAVIRTSGKNEITFTVNYPNEKYAMEIARKQYLAACRADFNPEPTKKADSEEEKSEITIKVNGKEIKPEDLFKERPNQWDEAKRAYKDQKRKTHNYIENNVAMRQEIQKIERVIERELAEPPQQGQNQGHGLG